MKVSKGIYILLALILGGIGAHKFYAGKWIAGILYLLFSWKYIPVIISALEVIIAMFKPSDEYGQIYV